MKFVRIGGTDINVNYIVSVRLNTINKQCIVRTSLDTTYEAWFKEITVDLQLAHAKGGEAILDYMIQNPDTYK